MKILPLSKRKVIVEQYLARRGMMRDGHWWSGEMAPHDRVATSTDWKLSFYLFQNSEYRRWVEGFKRYG